MMACASRREPTALTILPGIPPLRRPRARARGFTLVELLVVMAVVAIVAALATVGFRRTRLRAAEASIVSALTSINHAQFAYMQTCGKNRYAPTLAALRLPAPGFPSGYLSDDLSASDPLVKSGYVITMTGTEATEGDQTCTGLVPLDRYRITADPVSPGATGVYHFGTNTDRVIYQDAASFADDMPESGAPGHGEEIR
jgi:prepilin-type N-terminal cleavage/methylation domain-containing protein